MGTAPKAMLADCYAEYCLACAMALIREKRSAEIAKSQSEITMLLLCGMDADAVGGIYSLRIALTVLFSILSAMLIALIMGAFSLIALGIDICAAGVTCIIALVSSEIVIVR